MQTKKQKEEIVAQVTERARESKSIVFAEYAGLTVKESMELQREMRKSGGSLRVMKKTLLSIALKSAGIPVDATVLPGQIVTAFSPDEVSAAKIFSEFSKKHKALVIAAGSLGEKALSKDEVLALSKLPVSSRASSDACWDASGADFRICPDALGEYVGFGSGAWENSRAKSLSSEWFVVFIV
jgi:large subunit ribosomal protein L10